MQNYQKPRQKNDFWFYATIALGTTFLIGIVAFIAYQFGQKSSSPTISKELSVNSEKDNSLPINAVSKIPAANINSSPAQMPVSFNPSVSTVSAPTFRAISGEMFVVTKGRENIKLGLVEICAITSDKIAQWLKSKKDAAIYQIQVQEAKIVTLRSQKNAFDRETHPATERSFNFEAEQRRISLESDIRLAEIQLNYWSSPEYYLKGLTFCDVSAKTDSNGKYTLNLPIGRKYAIAAQTSRKVFDSSETYWWLLWEDQSNNQNIVFSNDNLMDENPPNKVLAINR